MVLDEPNYGAVHATPIAVNATWKGAFLRVDISGVGQDVGALLSTAVDDAFMVGHMRPDIYELGIRVDVRGPRTATAEDCRQAVLRRIEQAMRNLEDARAAVVAALVQAPKFL